MPIRPTIIGSISRPETAAEVPEDICRNVGTNAMAANMPRPSVKPIAVALTKTRFLNSDSGMIGSSARASAITNSTTAASRPRPQPQVSMAPQPWFFDPPKSVKKIRQVVAIESSSTPRMSIFLVDFLFGQGQREPGDDERARCRSGC